MFGDILFEVLEPLLVFIQDGKNSLLGFVLVILLNRSITQLFMGKYSSTKLPTYLHFYFFLSIEGL